MSIYLISLITFMKDSHSTTPQYSPCTNQRQFTCKYSLVISKKYLSRVRIAKNWVTKGNWVNKIQGNSEIECQWTFYIVYNSILTNVQEVAVIEM